VDNGGAARRAHAGVYQGDERARSAPRAARVARLKRSDHTDRERSS
jgi:hypothetical protein